MLRLTAILILSLATPMLFAGGGAKKKTKYKLEPGIYVEFNTSKGIILCELEYEKAPMTVASFVGLAEGKFSNESLEFTEPYFNGLIFHRVVPNFVIQGGDPTGTGSGSPGYKFFDETSEELKHNAAGILSMANSDPRNSKGPYSNTGMTNGSQFFITHKETPHLDGLHTVFGHVMQGQDVVDAIQQGDTMYTVRIIRKGKEAKKWNATSVFAENFVKAKESAINQFLAEAKQYEDMENFPAAKMMCERALNLGAGSEVTSKIEELNRMLIASLMNDAKKLYDAKNYEQARKLYEEAKKLDPSNTEAADAIMNIDILLIEIEAENQKYYDEVAKMAPADFNKFMHEEILKTYPDAKLSASGLVYIVEKEGEGRKISKGDKLSVHYRGTFRRDGQQFDASYDRGQPMEFTYMVQRMIPGFEEGLAMLGDGGKVKLFIPYHQAYGANGRGTIPPYADLVFDLEVMSVAPGETIEEHEHHEGDGHQH